VVKLKHKKNIVVHTKYNINSPLDVTFFSYFLSYLFTLFPYDFLKSSRKRVSKNHQQGSRENKMKKSLVYAVYLSTALSALQSVWSTPIETEAQVTSVIGALKPVYEYKATDAIRLKEITGISDTELDFARLGTPTIAAGTDSYFEVSAANELYLIASVGGAVRHFKVAVPATFSATGNLDVPEVNRDGDSSPASPYTFKITLTKTGAVADLTRAALTASLSKATTKTFAASAAGTVIASNPALPAGWAAKAYLEDGASTATAVTLDPVAANLTLAVTPVGSAALTYTAAFSSLYNWNIAPNSATKKTAFFTGVGRAIKFDVLPGKFPRTAGPLTNLIAALVAMPTRINQTTLSYVPLLTDANTHLLGTYDASAPASIKEGNNLVAQAILGSDNFVSAKFTTTADSGKIGLLALGATNITSVTWTVVGTVITATGTIGTGAPKDFTCDLSGIEVAKTGTNDLLRFSSADGDAFWLKVDDATGYDQSAAALGDNSTRDDQLAIQLHGLITGITTINAMKLKAMAVAAQS
jgi:hypothetical protein